MLCFFLGLACFVDHHNLEWSSSNSTLWAIWTCWARPFNVICSLIRDFRVYSLYVPCSLCIKLIWFRILLVPVLQFCVWWRGRPTWENSVGLFWCATVQFTTDGGWPHIVICATPPCCVFFVWNLNYVINKTTTKAPTYLVICAPCCVWIIELSYQRFKKMTTQPEAL